MKSSVSLSNQAIADKFGDELASGHVVVVGHLASSQKGAIRLELAQRRPMGSALRAPRSQFQQDFSMGELPIARAWHTVSTADTKDTFALGSVLEDMRLAVRDQLTPVYSGQEPRLTKDGTILVNSEDCPVYREIIPCYISEEYVDHIIPVTDSGEAWDGEDTEE